MEENNKKTITRYEYQIALNPTQEDMNVLGKDDWELVTVDRGFAYFRKPYYEVVQNVTPLIISDNQK